MEFKVLTESQATRLGKKSRADLVKMIDQMKHENTELEKQTVAYKFESFVSELKMLGEDLAWLINRTHDLGREVGVQVHSAFKREEEPKLLLPAVGETTITEYPY